MEIKLTAGETQDPVHTATDPPNREGSRRQALLQYSPTHRQLWHQKGAQKEKNCRNNIQNTKMVSQKPSRLNYFYKPQKSSLKGTKVEES